jgi:hypothetical protein
VMSIGAVLHGRREALAAEEGNWLTHPMDFSVSVANAHTGALVSCLPMSPAYRWTRSGSSLPMTTTGRAWASEWAASSRGRGLHTPCG